jgi:hypothetical protein
LAFEYILYCSNYCYINYNIFFGYVRDLPHCIFFLKCLQSISISLKCLPNRLDIVECLLSRLVTIHFLPLFIYLYAMFSAVNLGNIVLQQHCWFTGPFFLFASPLMSYLAVVVVLVCLFVLLQFARLGFCNRNWNCVIPGALVVACFFVYCMLFIVV